MATYGRWALRYPLLSNVADVPADMLNLVTDLNGVAFSSGGVIASRPVSTGGSPGKVDRYYWATDQSILYRDNGTGWDQVGVSTADTTVMRTNVIQTVTAQQTDAIARALTADTYGSGGSFTIANTYKGVAYVTATGVTLTLPAAASATGGPLIIVNASSGDLTVQRNTTTTTDRIDNANRTTAVIPAGGVMVLLPLGGTGFWRSVSQGGTALTDFRAQPAPIHGIQSLGIGGTVSATAGKAVRYTGAAGTLNLPPAVAGLEFDVHNEGSGVCTLDPSGAETINGSATHTLTLGERCRVVCLVTGSWIMIETPSMLRDRFWTTNVTAVMPDTGYDEFAFYGSTASQVMTLPKATSGRRIWVTNTGGVPVSIVRGGTDAIGGSTSNLQILAGQRVQIICVTDGTWLPQWTGFSGLRIQNGASAGVGDKASIVVTGDGANEMEFFGALWAYTGNAAQDLLNAEVRDGAGGTGSVIQTFSAPFPANFAGVAIPMHCPPLLLSAFTGTKTLYFRLVNANTAGSNVSSSSCQFRVRWAR